MLKPKPKNTAQPLAVFDIDGTIFRSSLYVEIVRQLIIDKVLPQRATREFDGAYEAWKERVDVDSYQIYLNAVIDAYESYLPTIKVTAFEAAAAKVVRAQKAHTYVYTRDLIANLKSQNYYLAAISASQSEVVERFAKIYGFDAFAGSEYGKTNNHFDGTYKILTNENKTKFMQELLATKDITLEKSVAVGDSEGDIAMLSTVERPIAFNPERKLFEHAKRNNWKIVVERKNVVYELRKENNGYKLDK